MSNLQESRRDIEIEDVAFRSSVSEAVGGKLGSSINFINRRQTDKHDFHLNGAYALGVGSSGPDGVFVFPFDAELVAYSVYSGTSGLSGVSTLDIHKLTGGDTDEGTIFTVKPSVSSDSVNGSYSAFRFIDNTTLAAPTGHTIASIISPLFNAGDAVRLDLDSAMSGGQTIQLTIYFRPR